jgi:hypothetical protein
MNGEPYRGASLPFKPSMRRTDAVKMIAIIE